MADNQGIDFNVDSFTLRLLHRNQSEVYLGTHKKMGDMSIFLNITIKIRMRLRY